MKGDSLMKAKLNTKKTVLWGAIVILLQMVLSNLLYMNPIVSKINKHFEGHSSIKTFDFFGGLGNWLTLTMIFGILLMIFWIFLYQKVYNYLPGKGITKGLFFGTIIGLIKSVPEVFNQWMVINYPLPLILVQLFNTFIGLVLFGGLMGFFFKKFNVIQEVPKLQSQR